MRCSCQLLFFENELQTVLLRGPDDNAEIGVLDFVSALGDVWDSLKPFPSAAVQEDAPEAALLQEVALVRPGAERLKRTQGQIRSNLAETQSEDCSTNRGSP